MSETTHSLIERVVRSDPNGPAMLALGAAPLSYAALLKHVRVTVRALNEIGVGHGDRVAVVLPNGPEMATCFLAVASTAVCAPLNPSFRAAEFEFYLDDLDAKALIVKTGVDTPARQVAKSRGIPVLELIPDGGVLAGLFTLKGAKSTDAGCRLSGPDDDALVLHTSGTTARPKLVPLTQANLVNSAQNTRDALGLTLEDRCLNVMPLFHIHGLVGAVLSSIAAGASVVCTPGFEAPAFMGWLEEFQPTWYSAVPTMHQAIVARAREARKGVDRGRLRFIRSSSAALAPSVLCQLEDVFGVPVAEAYGMTEAAHQMASNPLPPGHRKPGSVGQAAGPEIAVMNADGGFVPPGATGEVVIRGANVTRGYADPSEANVTAFHEGWFRTGDHGYLDADGYLFLTGRIKEIINCGGEKVSPREIDEVLLEHPDVEQAVAFALQDARLGEAVGAAVVLQANSSATELELKEFCASRVADFKVPRRIVILDAIPMGATGKLQRIGLGERLGVETTPALPKSEEIPLQPPVTPVEMMLCQLWRNVLGIERVGVHDNFFHLGGDSVLATKFVARLRDATGAELSLARLFDQPTVQAVADWLNGEGRAPRAGTGERIGRRPSAEAISPSFAEEGMWFLHRLTQEPSILNRPMLLRVRGDLRADVLQRSLSEIVVRHEILRTTYHDVDGRLLPVVEAPHPVTVPLTDLTDLPEAERWKRVKHIVAEEGRRPFDLEKDRLLRVHVLRIGEEEHALFLTMHHIASDGWSSRVVLQELDIAYEAACQQDAHSLPDLTIQYRDYAYWHRQRLQGLAREELESYWKRALKDLPAPLELPSDHPKPAVETHEGAVLSFTLPPRMAADLRALGAQEGTTLFMTLLGAFQVLLSRYTGREDFLVGTVVANRTHRQTEPLVGLFMNMLALRANLCGRPTFRELLARVRAATVEAYSHQELPFKDVVRAVNPRRYGDDDSIIQVLFQLRNLPEAEGRIYDLEIEELETDVGIAEFDLFFEVRECEAGIQCLANYKAERFESETIQRLLGHYATLLDGAIASPDAPISTLPLLTEDERRSTLVDWNETTREWPNHGVIELFEEHAARLPERAALLCGSTTLSYGELNERVNQLAHRLRRLGVGPGNHVGLCVERSFNMVVGMLGIMKAGAAYVPLDPEYPSQRLALMLEDADPVVLLATQRARERLPACEVQTLWLDTDWASMAAESPENPPSLAESNDPAYVIYTSGSTGRPKGVVIPHAALTNFVQCFRDAFALDQHDRVLQATSPCFDLSVGEIFPTLAVGGCIVLPRPGGQRDPACLARLLNETQVTVVHVVPSLLRALTEQTAFARNASLRVGILAGEALTPQLQERFFALSDAELYNAYGPTEATVLATFWKCQRGSQSAPRVPIGSPLANYQVYVLDGKLQPLPVGVPGELYIGGSGLASGYFNAPALTAERFIANPFSANPGARLYKTGDQARYLADGSIDFLGRLDHQVKIRGYRVELSEVEWIVRQHPGIRETVATLHVDPLDAGSLAAYFVPRNIAAPTAPELREFVSQRLPEHMVPTWFVQLDSMPRTPNGKLDRGALPAPESSVGEALHRDTSSSSPVDVTLMAIWGEVLGHTRIRKDTDFFTIGGDSLKAVRCVSKINEALGIGLTLRAFLARPTIAAIADAASDRRDNALVTRIPSRGNADPCCLSFAQKRIWFLDKLEPNSPKYNVVEAFRWRGNLNPAILARSLSALVDRHEILRTTYHHVVGKPVQVVGDLGDVDVRFFDLRATSAKRRSDEAERELRREAARPFDLSRDLPLRVSVWRVDDEESLVLFNVHHIACDGWSFGILHRELAEFYGAFSAGRSVALPEMPIQYADFCVWQSQQRSGERWATGLAYWKDRLSGPMEPLSLPADRSKPDSNDFRGGTATLPVQSAVAEALRALSTRARVTPFTVVVAAFQAFLSRLSGQLDVSIGSPMAAREQPECEGLIGFFANTVVLRLDLSGDPTFETLLQRAREMVHGAVAHQSLSFDTVVEAVNPPREQGHNPLFDVMLEYNVQRWNSFEVYGAQIEQIPVPTALARFAIALYVNERPRGLHLRALYRRALFSDEHVHRMLHQFVALLVSAAANPATLLSELQILTDAERRRLLDDWNDTVSDYPSDHCMHHLFEAQVERTPDAAAVRFGDTEWSFRELNRRANRIAHELRGMGVGRDVLVGIYLDRGPEMLSALLGILKAGGAYVPLDRRWPRVRLAQVIDDARLSIAVTDQQGARSLPDGLKSVVYPIAEAAGKSDTKAIENPWDVNPEHLSRPNDLAYVIYTSGSTGEPKGVLVEHRSLINYVWGMLAKHNLRALSSFAVVQSLSVDSSVTSIYGSLLAGACMHLISEEQSLDAAALSAHFRDHPIDFLKIAPSHLMAINAELSQPLMPRKMLLVGGEASRWAWISELRAAAPDCEIINHYGPTEATVGVTTYAVSKVDGAAEATVTPIGRPLPNVRAYVLDKHGNPVAPGVEGELYLGGDCLARGYLNKPEITRQAFVHDSVSATRSGRLYRTGDRARYLPDGDLEYLGRRDGQVKVRGYRVELGEIEAAIATYPGVKDVAVTAEETGIGGTRLVAVVATKNPHALSLAVLRSSLKERLPDYMLPSGLVLLGALPRSVQGKLDRRALASAQAVVDNSTERLSSEGPDEDTSRSLVEDAILDIWSRVLDTRGIGVHDSFFDIGGHSLSVMRVIGLLRSELNVDIPVRTVFDYPTVAELAMSIENGVGPILTHANRSELP